MRLVSVVVPLWLMATTNVSDMSSRSWKPENSVATTASARSWSFVERPEDRGQALSGDGGGALADHHDPPDAAVAQARPQVVGQRVGAQGDVELPVALDDLPAQGLAERRRRLGDLLQQEVGEVAAVDVASGDLGVLELVG